MNYYYQPNPQGTFSYFEQQARTLVTKIKERKRIRLIGSVAGGCILLYIILQNVLSVPVALEPFRSAYALSLEFRCIVNIIFSILGLLVPFVLGALILHKKKVMPSLAFGKPDSFALMLASVPFGFLVCLIGNYVTSVFVSLTRNTGVELTSPEYSVPQSLAGRIIYIVSVAVVPALVEEFAIRGVVMQPLRRYGDKFAIIVSAAVFGILHGNLVQAPFAFIAGLGMGYAVCLTNSIWTGVLIHFCNNFYSTQIDFLLADVSNEALLNAIWNISQVMLYGLCISGSVLFVLIKGKKRLAPAKLKLETGTKLGAYFINAPMIIAIIIMLRITAEYIHLID